MFERQLEELADDVVNGQVDVLSSFAEAPDREPDEYHWFSLLDGDEDGLSRDAVQRAYTVHDIPSTPDVVVLAIWKRPNNAHFVHGSLGTVVNSKYGEV